MGVVYKARDRRLKRLVAIKMMLASEHASPDQRARFRVEAEAGARLKHVNIVQVYEVGEHKNQPYIAFEFAGGPDLTTFVNGQPQPERFSAEITAVLATAMHYAHGQGILHRDLKPANVLLTEPDSAAGERPAAQDHPLENADARNATVVFDRQDTVAGTSSGLRESSRDGSHHTPIAAGGWIPKITDFGLAKQLDSQSDLTTTGTIVGTPQYMAPEQATGAIHLVGPPADIYALGAILYFMITGRPPFHGVTATKTVEMVCRDDPIPPTAFRLRLSKDLETICLKCLEKEPARRYGSAEDLARELQRFLHREPILARPVSSPERTWRWCRRNPLVAALSAACLAILLVGFAVVTWKWREASANFVEAKAARATAEAKQREANEQSERAVEADLQRQLYASQLLFRRGQELCEADQVDKGLLWLAESLKESPNRDKDLAWRKVIRLNLAGWRQRLHRIQYRFVFPKRPGGFAIQPGGDLLVIGCFEGLVYRYNLATGRFIGEPSTTDLPRAGWSAIRAVAFHPRGKWFLAGGGVHFTGGDPAQGIVQRFDSLSGEAIGLPVKLPYSVSSGGIAVSPDGEQYAVDYRDPQLPGGTIEVRRSKDHEQIKLLPLPGKARDVEFSYDSKLVSLDFQENGQRNRRAFDIATGLSVAYEESAFPLNLAKKESLTNFAPQSQAGLIDTEQRHLFSSGVMVGEIRQLARTASRLKASPVERLSPRQRSSLPEIRRVKISSDHLTAAIRTGDGAAYLLDISGNGLLRKPLDHPFRVLSVAISPAGKLCATGGRKVRLWDLATGEPRSGWMSHSEEVGKLAFSPDGKILAAGDYAMQVRLWDVESGQQIGKPLPHRDIVVGLAFSPDGKKLLVGTASDWNHDPQARLWDVARQRPIGPPMKHKSSVGKAEFSGDGSKMLTGTRDTVSLWDAQTAEPVCDPIVYSHEQGVAIFRPDGKWVLTGSNDGDVRAWDAETGRPIDRAIGEGSALIVPHNPRMHC